MPFFWIREGSNFVAIKFTKPAEAKVTETFATPSTTDNVDKELLEYLKGMAVGDAIEISLKDSGLKTERSLKVRLGKHAKMANRELEARTASDGSFIFRVSAILEPQVTAEANGTANGTENANVEALTQEPTTGEETTTRRGR